MIDPGAFDGRELRVGDVRQVDAANFRADRGGQRMYFDRALAMARGIACRRRSHSSPPEIRIFTTMLSEVTVTVARSSRKTRGVRACSAPPRCRRARD